eukprot:s1049_g4.t1
MFGPEWLPLEKSDFHSSPETSTVQGLLGRRCAKLQLATQDDLFAVLGILLGSVYIRCMTKFAQRVFPSP